METKHSKHFPYRLSYTLRHKLKGQRDKNRNHSIMQCSPDSATNDIATKCSDIGCHIRTSPAKTEKRTENDEWISTGKSQVKNYAKE